MLIGSNSKYLLKKTRSKAKMYEYSVPSELHITVEDNANELLLIAIAAIGNVSANVLNENNPYRIIPADKKAELEFASHYFDAFLQSKLEPCYPQYYFLLGAIAYYLCDYAGSAKVMANMIMTNELDLDCNGIEKVLALLLQDKIEGNNLEEVIEESSYSCYLYKIVETYIAWFQHYEDVKLDFIKKFRALIYAQGSGRELLLTDALLAILLMKKERSALNLLPKYSEIPSSDWEGMLKNKKNIHELWPAQIRLGEAGVFSGKSAIIQMPTSSGKTTSMSIAIRASFLAERTNLAIIVAPFRALCREITDDIANDFLDNKNVHVNAFSDILEMDELMELLESFDGENKNIMVLTPEKLIYLLRQDIDIIKETGLIIFDEAHMFDDASRGAQYELLISTIMMYLDENTQKLLLSAVIPNAKEINDWFTGGKGVVIADNTIRATEKSIAIADWEISSDDMIYGYLYFLDSENRNNLEFYVPRIIEIKKIEKLRNNEKERFFPSVNFQTAKVEYNDIAIYLALKLNHNGGVAIFCGRKDTVDGVLKRIIEIENRGIDISSFANLRNDNENEKLARLIKENYGQDNIYYKTAMKGIFAHHRGISNGIRIATEYAMKENLIRCIVCTSTLAQGVNLPIRYLIISSIYQAQERIKVRDFHNLIGRAGRAGLYTEGTIVLSETFVYSQKNQFNGRWRWNNYLEMLDSGNSEACLSQFLLLVRPELFEVGYNVVKQFDFYSLALKRYDNYESFEDKVAELLDDVAKNYPSILHTFLVSVNRVNLCLDAIESYLLSFLTENNEQNLDSLVSSTFGYFLASEEEKDRMRYIFSIVKENLLTEVNDIEKRKVFSRTLLGTKQLLELEIWVIENSEALMSCETFSEILQMIIPKLVKYSENKCLKAVITEIEIFNIANMWISGMSYKQILEYAIEKEIMIVRRKKEAVVQLDEIIDICDNGFGYTSTLIINAISELLQFNYEESKNICKLLADLSKQMRYGLPSKKSIIIYESGFADRVVSLMLATELKGISIKTKKEFKRIAKQRKDNLLGILTGFPRLFSDRMSEL
ncbi:MAG: DEAD/DEAH box helicase [Acidaminococcaceae bacterium]